MPKTMEFEHGYALLVGVGADLPVTAQDARAVRDILTDPNRCGYSHEHVRLLTESQATRQGILDGLDWLIGEVQSDSHATVTIYFSGHGGGMPGYHLVAYGYDAADLGNTAVSGSEFTERLSRLHGSKLLVLLDCCHAGGMADIKGTAFAKAPFPPELAAILTKGSGRAVIASSRKDEVSYAGTPYSIFTQALREGLAGYGAAERDGYAKVADVAMYIGRMVPNRSNDRQHPILKLVAADNFAIAYYAGGEKSPRALPGAQSHISPIEVIEASLVEGYRRVLKQYQSNLLVVEERMAQFFDQAAVPLDLERTKRGILGKISEIEAAIERQAEAAGWMLPMALLPGSSEERACFPVTTLDGALAGAEQISPTVLSAFVRETCTSLLGPLNNVPSLPPHYLPRPENLAGLSRVVLVDSSGPTIITSALQTATLQGMAGIGKSVLAAAFARSQEIRRRFPDGIIWLTVGQQPNVKMLMQVIGQALKDEMRNYVEFTQARTRLAQLLADKACLIILDDVWNIKHVEPFSNAIGPRCRLLLTTRDGGLSTALGAQEYSLDVLSNEDAINLLRSWAEVEGLPSEATEVAGECGNLPFALALCGAMVRDGTSWVDLLESLREADLSFIEKQLPNYPYPNMLRALKVSIDLLQPDEVKHYQELAVFPEDARVPEEAVLTFWMHTNHLTRRQARKLLTTLGRKALLRLESDGDSRHITLHDLQHDYLRSVMDNLTGLHIEMLAAYREKCSGGWHTGPNDGYFFQRLVYHLNQAGASGEAYQLLTGFSWLQEKLNNTGVNALAEDYDTVLPTIADSDSLSDTSLQTIREALRLSAHSLATDRAQLAAQLLGRLLLSDLPGVKSLLTSIDSTLHSGIYLLPKQSALTPPNGPLVRTILGHSSVVAAVAVTSDGNFAVSGSYDATLRLWDLETGIGLRVLSGHTALIRAVAVTSDGRYAVSASRDTTVRIWDLPGGVELRTLRGHSYEVCAVAVTSDGTRIASGARDGTIKVWDLDSGVEQRTLTGHTDSVYALAVTPDGHCVISGSRDRTLRIWDLFTGTELRTLRGHQGDIFAVTITADGRYAISGSRDGTVKVWEVQTGYLVHTLVGHTYSVKSVAVSKDGQFIVSGSYDKTIRIWSSQTGKELALLEGNCGVYSVAMTPDGRYAITGSFDKALRVWDMHADRGTTLSKPHTDTICAIGMTGDGRYAVTGSWDSTLKIWDLQPLSITRTLVGHKGSVQAVAVTSDGRYIISGGQDHTIRVWDPATGAELQTLLGHRLIVMGLALTPDNRYVLSASGDRTLGVWDLLSGERLHTLCGHQGTVYAVAVTEDGRYGISGSQDHSIKVWDLCTGQEVRTLLGHSDDVDVVVSIPGSEHILSASADCTLRVWNWRTGREVRKLQGHRARIRGLAVTVNGQYAVSGSVDATLKVWDLQKGICVSTFNAENLVYSCAITPADLVLAGNRTGQVMFLQLATIKTP